MTQRAYPFESPDEAAERAAIRAWLASTAQIERATQHAERAEHDGNAAQALVVALLIEGVIVGGIVAVWWIGKLMSQ